MRLIADFGGNPVPVDPGMFHRQDHLPSAHAARQFLERESSCASKLADRITDDNQSLLQAPPRSKRGLTLTTQSNEQARAPASASRSSLRFAYRLMRASKDLMTVLIVAVRQSAQSRPLRQG
jgi:hypothetical protein